METNVYKALELLMQQSEYSQCKFFRFCDYNPNAAGSGAHLIDEYCTVSIKCARRSGHTHSIFQLIDKYFQDDTVVYCGFNAPQIQSVKQEWRKDFNESKVDLIFATRENLVTTLRGNPNPPDAVFLDCASFTQLRVEFIQAMSELASIKIFQKKKPFYFVKVQ